MRPTVHDIAAEAGVSLATVDRVLNNRPGVRSVTRDKVERAIATLGYVRDVAAANLAKSRSYPLVFILPEGENAFMRGLEAEIEAARSRSAVERTDIAIVSVPAFDAAALAAALDDARSQGPAGVAVVAVEAPEVVAAVGRLREDGIAVVTLVSDLTGSARDHFAGVDNLAAGRTAGSLMRRFLGSRQGPVAIVAGSMRVRDHRDRLEGFSAAVNEEGAGRKLLPVVEGHDDPGEVEALVDGLLAAHAGLAGIYSLGAGNRGLIAALEKAGRQSEICAIAHELTPYSRAALVSGTIDALLNQDAGHEVRSAIRVLKARADGLSMIEAQERIRIEIFLRDNLPVEPAE